VAFSDRDGTVGGTSGGGSGDEVEEAEEGPVDAIGPKEASCLCTLGVLKAYGLNAG